MSVLIFLVVTTCQLIDGYRRFRRKHCLNFIPLNGGSVLPKRRYLTEILRGVKNQKTNDDMFTSVCCLLLANSVICSTVV